MEAQAPAPTASAPGQAPVVKVPSSGPEAQNEPNFSNPAAQSSTTTDPPKPLGSSHTGLNGTSGTVVGGANSSEMAPTSTSAALGNKQTSTAHTIPSSTSTTHGAADPLSSSGAPNTASSVPSGPFSSSAFAAPKSDDAATHKPDTASSAVPSTSVGQKDSLGSAIGALGATSSTDKPAVTNDTSVPDTKTSSSTPATGLMGSTAGGTGAAGTTNSPATTGTDTRTGASTASGITSAVAGTGNTNTATGNADNATGTNGTGAATGVKRKADDINKDETSAATATSDEPSGKKQKKGGLAGKVSAAIDKAKEKMSPKKKAPKKERAPVGKTERKTRSQGNV